MRQANAEIGLEFAGYFPAVSLSGLIGYSGNPFATEFGPSNPVWSFEASLAQPLFNGGLTTAQVEAARQTYQADVGTYRQTVLSAIQQVEDALVGDSHPLARGQGAGGGRAHLPAGNSDHAQRIQGGHPGLHRRGHCGDATVERRGESLLSTQGQLQADAVDLIVALGGGWSQAMLPDVTAQTSAVPPH